MGLLLGAYTQLSKFLLQIVKPLPVVLREVFIMLTQEDFLGSFGSGPSARLGLETDGSVHGPLATGTFDNLIVLTFTSLPSNLSFSKFTYR